VTRYNSNRLLRQLGYALFQNRLDRAKWSPYHTKIFCKLYCDQIDLGYCNRGQMSKWGWKNIIEQYFQATELVHDNVTFDIKVRELKKEWSCVRKLQHKSTGLGRSADGSVNASDEWWEENNKVHLILSCTQLLSKSSCAF
jgi:hypothetical protein